MKNVKEINDNLIKFWDSSLTLTAEQKEEIQQSQEIDYKELAPSPKLFDAVAGLSSCQKVLDYGCGSGWGAIIANKSGCLNVDAVDIGVNIIESLKVYTDALNTHVNAFSISPDWLKSVPNNYYDGIICSNVLDVLPIETTKEILKQLARISTPKAKVIIGLNFYMPPDVAKQRGMELIKNKYLFVNDVLRLLSLSDIEWKELFSPYFIIEKLDYFAWPGEAKETRRLFLLIRK